MTIIQAGVWKQYDIATLAACLATPLITGPQQLSADIHCLVDGMFGLLRKGGEVGGCVWVSDIILPDIIFSSMHIGQNDKTVSHVLDREAVGVPVIKFIQLLN